MSERLPLFVYGTLMSAGSQGGLLAGLRRRDARVRGTLWRLPAGYPALAVGGRSMVYGELVDPPDERILGLCDHYEGVDEGLYARTEVVAMVGLLQERAWAYVMASPRLRGGRLLPDGRWVPRRRG